MQKGLVWCRTVGICILCVGQRRLTIYVAYALISCEMDLYELVAYFDQPGLYLISVINWPTGHEDIMSLYD